MDRSIDYESLLRGHRKKKVADAASLPVTLHYGREKIKRIIPHREPFLLIDSLSGLDPEEGIIAGKRYLGAEEPVLQGHFPQYPVYPGSLQIEMIGQLGLCMHYFITNNTTSISPEAAPVDVRATRVIGAYYLGPVLPGREITIVARKLEYDEFFATVIGQTIVDDTVCSVVAGEVVFP